MIKIEFCLIYPEFLVYQFEFVEGVYQFVEGVYQFVEGVYDWNISYIRNIYTRRFSNTTGIVAQNVAYNFDDTLKCFSKVQSVK